MKKIILVIILTSSFSLGQSWNPIVTTTLNEPNLTKMDLFTNKDGNHLLVRRDNGNIVYYNLNSSGIVNAGKTITLEVNGDYPNIVGSDNIVFAIYLKGSLIKGKYSTNGGSSWQNLSYSITTTGNECNGIDAIFDPARGIHLVWATKDDNNYNFETYYHRLNLSTTPYQWVDFKQVTDYPGEVGGQPSVTFSSDRVHVSYNTNYWSTPFYGYVKSRDKYLNNWQIPQSVIVGSEMSALEKLISRGDSLFIIFAKAYVDPYIVKWDICAKKRSITGSTWSNTTLIEMNIFQEEIGVSKTFNNYIHTIYKPGSLNHSYYNGYVWSVPVQISDYIILRYGMSLFAQSNDLYCFWEDGSSTYIKYRQYDAAPLAPQNPQLSANPGNNRIRISWARNNEADISSYEIWRKVAELGGVWQNIGTTTNNYFVDNEYFYAPGAGDFTLTYKVRAKDIGNHYSEFSQGVTTRGEYLGKKYMTAELNEFRLNDNYPNPFNPTTKISWQAPVNGHQTLKVYDILGREVATLVDEYREAGSYELEFDASGLPSGVYIYKLQSAGFSAVKKMILNK